MHSASLLAEYRIPQNNLERKSEKYKKGDEKMEGYKETSCQQIIMELPNQDDTAEKLLLYKAYSNPQYLFYGSLKRRKD